MATLLRIGDDIINLDNVTQIDRRNNGPAEAPQWVVNVHFGLNYQHQFEGKAGEGLWNTIAPTAESVPIHT